MIRNTIKTALVTAMKSGDKGSTAAIRLIQSAIKTATSNCEPAPPPPTTTRWSPKSSRR